MPMDAKELCLDAKFRRWAIKKRIVDLRSAVSRGDIEGVATAARLVSGQLGPEALLDVSQFALRELISSFAQQAADLKDTLSRITEPFDSLAVSNAISRLAELESSAGRFDIWVKQPRHAYCESLIRAALKGEEDFEDYLIWLRRSELRMDAAQLDPYIAQVLLDMRVSGDQIRLPGRMENLVGLDESEIYPRIVRLARRRKWADEENGKPDRVRLTVGRNGTGRDVRQYGVSLDTEHAENTGIRLKETLPDLVTDPIEFLLSTQQSVKLSDLADMRAGSVADERWGLVHFTLDEYRYVRLHHGHGMTQKKAGEFLRWEPSRVDAVRRNADLKIKKYRETGTAEDKRKLKKY